MDKFCGELRDTGGKISISKEADAPDRRYRADSYICMAVSAAGQ